MGKARRHRRARWRHGSAALRASRPKSLAIVRRSRTCVVRALGIVVRGPGGQHASYKGITGPRWSACTGRPVRRPGRSHGATGAGAALTIRAEPPEGDVARWPGLSGIAVAGELLAESLAYSPSWRMSSACVPRSTIRPRCMTRIWSARRIVESRCAMAIVVRPSMSRCEGRLDEALADGVERGGRLVEDEDPRVLEQHARDRHALLLAAGELVAALADDGVVAVGQLRMRSWMAAARAASSISAIGRVRLRVAQVREHGVVEQVGLLGHEADRPVRATRA